MIKEELNEYLEEFESMDSTMDILKLIVEYGKELDEYPQEMMLDEYKIPGCISEVYIRPSVVEGRIHIDAFSDALIIAGYLEILLSIINGKTPQEVYDSWGDIEEFTKKSGFKENLSPTRANAFGTILTLIYSFVENHLH